MTGAGRQLLALLLLRWQMVRSTGLRGGLIGCPLVLLWLLDLIIGTAGTINPVVLATIIEVAPIAFLGFAFLAMIAPLTAGGGNEVVPPDQLVGFPVRPETQFLGGLALAPLNLVWLLQLVGLVATTAFLSFGGNLAVAGLTTFAYVSFLTVLGQTVAWTVVGVRQSRRGRAALSATALLLGGLVIVARLEGLANLRPELLTERVVLAISAGALSNYGLWAPTTTVLGLMTVVCFVLGSRACRWALARPGDAGTYRQSAPVRRRSAAPSPLRELIAVDRASVWRARALRRGGIVLIVLPGLLAMTITVPWESMIVLPGLIAAGAGLLFGTNAFCLDGSGAVWVASLPHEPSLVARAKALVLAETVLGASVVATVCGSLNSPGDPTRAQFAAIVASALTCVALVVAGGLKLSTKHPHRADLRGHRDAVAPPGALAAASARLAVPPAVVGALLGSASQTGIWWWPPLLAVPVVLLAVLSIMRSLRRYDDPHIRARIVQTVAAG